MHADRADHVSVRVCSKPDCSIVHSSEQFLARRDVARSRFFSPHVPKDWDHRNSVEPGQSVAEAEEAIAQRLVLPLSGQQLAGRAGLQTQGEQRQRHKCAVSPACRHAGLQTTWCMPELWLYGAVTRCCTVSIACQVHRWTL